MTSKAATPALTSRTLAAHEAVIERGLSTFIEVGAALLAIRDGRLYRKSYRTFEAYLRERWGWGRSYANKLVAAAEAATVLGTFVPNLPAPTSESQVRPLLALSDDEERADAWAEAVEAAGGQLPTQAIVAKVVGRRLAAAAPPPAETVVVEEDGTTITTRRITLVTRAAPPRTIAVRVERIVEHSTPAIVYVQPPTSRQQESARKLADVKRQFRALIEMARDALAPHDLAPVRQSLERADVEIFDRDAKRVIGELRTWCDRIEAIAVTQEGRLEG